MAGEPPAGMSTPRAGAQGPADATQPPRPKNPNFPPGAMNSVAGNLDHFGRQGTQILREGIEDSIEADKALERRASEHQAALRASRDDLQARLHEKEPPAYAKFPANSPALTINGVVGVVGAAAYLTNNALSAEQISAVTLIVAFVFAVVPIIAGWLIKAINSRNV